MVENKVFIAYGKGSSSSNYPYGIVCTIEGTTITAGTEVQLSSGSSKSGLQISAILMAENKVFIAHGYGSNYYLYGIVCTISGTTITAGTDTQLSSTEKTMYNNSAVTISENKIFIVHYLNSRMYGIVCTISGTTITLGTDTQLNSNSTTYQNSGGVSVRISAILMAENKVFFPYINSSYTNDILYGVICTIEGTTITLETETELTRSGDAGGITAIPILITSNMMIIIYEDIFLETSPVTNNIRSVKILTYKIKNNQFSKINEVVIDDTYNVRAENIISLQNKIFAMISKGNNGYSRIVLYNKVKKINSISQHIYGVAKTSGTAGQTIQIYAPNYN